MSLLYILPDNTRITIRDVDAPLRKVVTHVQNRWQGDRVSVVIWESVHIDNGANYGGNTVAAKLLNLVDGALRIPIVTLDYSQGGDTPWNGYAGVLEHGVALVIFKRKGTWRGEQRDTDVTFYLRSFSEDDRVVDHLGIARDAMLAGQDADAARIAREVLPHSHGLFTALVKRERSKIREAEKQAGV